MRRIHSFLFLFLILMAAGPVLAQQADPMEQGILAFREARYQEAAAAFEKAIAEDDQNAEAYFLLARVYFETPLNDVKSAGKALDRALELDPDNVQYLVARLQQYRAGTRFFLTEKIRESKRRELAKKILELDPTNAFAHEELGEGYIRDFWRYRNALMFPLLNNEGFAYRSPDQGNALDNMISTQMDQFDANFQAVATDFGQLDAGANLLVPDGVNPNSVFLADDFDVETLREQGVPVQDLSGRALQAYDKAITHLEQALETDPRHASVYDHMMRVFALKGGYDDAQEMLQQMYVFFPENDKLWMYLGLTHYRLGNMEAASKAFETSLSYMDENTRDAFNRLDEILPLDEKKKYEADPATYVSRFWTSKDPRYLTPYNERKLEHYARLIYADLLYGAPDMNLRGWDTQRGGILVRYGVPKADVVIVPRSTSSVNTRSSVAGAGASFSNPTGENTGSSGAFLTQAWQGTGTDMLAEANTFNIWDYGEFKFVFEDPFRNGEYRLYSPRADAISQGANPWINDYEIKARETFRAVPERYNYEAPGRQIEVPYLVAAFKGEAGQTDLYVNYGIPIVSYDPSQELLDITANTGTFLISQDRDILFEQRRTIYGLATEQIVPFEESNLWIDTRRMTVPPGEHEVSIEFETASGNTVAVQRRPVTVPAFGIDRLALSDLMLAYRIEETIGGQPAGKADIVRDGLSILPAPWSVFSHQQPIYLFFEVYNLATGDDGRTDYEMEAILVPKDQAKGVRKLVQGVFGGGNKGVSVRLPGAGSDRDEGQYLIMDATNQEPGLYTLILKVRDNVAGRDVETEQDLFLE